MRIYVFTTEPTQYFSKELEKLMQALEQRENADILNKSSDEIKKMIKDLENEE